MHSSITVSIVLVILSLTVNVKSQTCDNASAYRSCSLNSACGCLPYSFSASIGICGDISSSCSQFDPCLSPNDACAQAGYVCVRHSRCSSSPICYPLSMTDRSVCPPIIVTNYTDALTINSQNYSRGGSSGSFYYYQAIEVTVGTTGNYTFRTSSAISDTYGYLYQGNFYPSYTTVNLITQDDDGSGSGQFQLRATLRADIKYILIFTTYTQRATGSFSISATGPDNVYYNAVNI